MKIEDVCIDDTFRAIELFFYKFTTVWIVQNSYNDFFFKNQTNNCALRQ